jgi:hypothetical protein
MANYIDAIDITDRIIAEFVTKDDARVPIWLTRTTDEIDALAERLDVAVSSIIWSGASASINPNGTEMHPKILEYGRTYFCLQVCEDNVGSNKVDSQMDEIYRIKLQYYSDKLKDLRGQISPSMFTCGDDALTAEENVGSQGIIWRG